MTTKREELAGLTKRDVEAIEFDPHSTPGCLAKAALDEPVFIIRASDRIAPGAVRDWAERARKIGAPEEKWRGGMDAAIEFETWQAKNPGLVKVPD